MSLDLEQGARLPGRGAVSEPACVNCQFGQSWSGEAGDFALLCKRYPPQHVRAAYNGAPRSEYLHVRPTMWCGEWRAVGAGRG